jgi:tRNA-Thr(GGU) m(6)t(6)A37 methyltransferase TsaA
VSLLQRIFVKTIGFVRNELTESEVRDRNCDSDVVIYKEYEAGLEGIEDFSHLNVIFWMDRIRRSERKLLKARPRGHQNMPMLGIFATRSPHRPNPIGLTLVKLVERRGNILRVNGLDALNDTPILDLKPYDKWDSAEHMKVPRWWMMLERERTSR